MSFKERITLNAEKRDKVGKGSSRQLRRGGMIPAVLYRAGSAESIKISHKSLTQFLKTTQGQQVLVSLRFDDGKERLALLKEYQLDPIDAQLLHADFFEVSLKERVRAKVHISTLGEPIGVKRDAGILQHGIREIEIECLPERMPGHIEVDISGLSIGHSVHVKDLRLGEGIKVLTEPAELIATVTAPVVEKALPEAVAPTVEEPEVIKKGKKEEEKEEEKA